MVPRTLQGTKPSELKSSLDPLIKNAIERNVVEIKAEAFIRAFLYPSARLDELDPVMKRDFAWAEACLAMLKKPVAGNNVLMPTLKDANCPKYSKNAFTLLDVTREGSLYTPFRKLFTFINEFYRVSLATVSLDIDAAWPAAIDPKTPEDSRSSTDSLRRDFFDTHDIPLKFSPRLAEETADLKPDLVLMLHHDKDPNKKQPTVYWKDVKVPIEVKTTFKSEGEIIPQVARYARAILMEQFDRKYALTASLSATQCRLFHWDSVGCHVTEPIDIHDDPILFIRCIARLAMMTPEELGYDEHFSNAGRVLCDEEITTTLTVRASPIRQYIDREPGYEEMPPEAAMSMLLQLDTKKFLFESRGMLFHRYTRVWRGEEITDVNTWRKGPTRVVKQNWAEDTRPSEGYFYKLTEEIPAVCSLVLMEECDHTWVSHNRVPEQHVMGYLKATETKPRKGATAQSEGSLLDSLGQRSSTPPNVSSNLGQSLERVLLRFVFEEEYRPLSTAKDALEVLDATVQWIQGLIELDRSGIVHRDISYSNLMLPATDQELGPGRTAKIIDLGLAHWKDPQRSNGIPSRPLDATSSVPEIPTDGQKSLLEASAPTARVPLHHHHITGTLPFIALDLIRQLQRKSKTGFIEHALHHDVESVFWVLVYFCLLRARNSGATDFLDTLDQLTSPKPDIVVSAKGYILGIGSTDLMDFAGPWHELGEFLTAFADHYFTCSRDRRCIDPFEVLKMAIEHRDKHSQQGKESPTLATIQQESSMSAPRSTVTFDSPKRKLSLLDGSSEADEGREESEHQSGASPPEGRRSLGLKSPLFPLIKNEIEQNVVEVKAEGFIRAFLYPSSPLGEQDPAMKRDLHLAVACHNLLKDGSSNNEVLMPVLADSGCPKYSEGAFTLLDAAKEEDLCTPLRKLFTFINAFHRVSLANQPVPLDIDVAWPAAVDPRSGAPTSATSLTGSLRRDCFDMRYGKLKLSPRFVGKTANLKPDLVLMLHHNKDPNKKQPPAYWKDVKVPIEVKRNFHSEEEVILQMACYAHALLMEQFDRKFVITVSVSATKCRLFHWDTVGCHCTEPIDIHNDPILFIRCIARLAMMTPAELGYDEHFSNAGRVLSNQKIATTLTMRASPVWQNLDGEPGSEEMPLVDGGTPLLLELDTEDFLSESRGMLFHPYTRVRRGKEITDVNTWKTGPTRVVKQSWAEGTWPREGYFYKLAKDIPAVCSLVLMEECDSTWAYHNRVAKQDVIGCLKTVETKPDRQLQRDMDQQAEGDFLSLGPDPLYPSNIDDRPSPTLLSVSPGQGKWRERVLLRFVFEEEYRPLRKARHSSEVLTATAQWIQGLIALDRLGIVHRNISYSNLMLPAIDIAQELSPQPVAKIIDLSQADFKQSQSRDRLPSRPLCVNSISPETPSGFQTSFSKGSNNRRDSPPPEDRPPRAQYFNAGTLPFIALDLMEQLRSRPRSGFIEHALHHDIESVFWVLVYLCHVRAGERMTDVMAMELEDLTDPRAHIVALAKSCLLGRGRKVLAQITGPFYGLRDFLKAFADYHHACTEREQPINAFEVLDIVLEHRDKLVKKARENAASVAVQQLSLMTPIQPPTTLDSSKRKFSKLEDALEAGEGEEETSKEESGIIRKKTKQVTSMDDLL
ncbi:hypothetical protein FRC01_001513 [Tulasnella sp. 417]|nr:hypothetical protein FRC01_001513 [Tulasnella sp. 417]